MISKDKAKSVFKRVILWYSISFIAFLLIDFLADNLPSYGFYSIIPIVGLLGGPYGALGVALASLCFDVCFDMQFYPFFDYIFWDILSAFVVFVSAYLTYKFWYSFDSYKLPFRLNSIESIVKSFIIIGISSMMIVVTWFPYMVLDDMILVFTKADVFELFLTAFNFALVLIPIVLLSNYFNFSFYYPGKVDINFLESFYNKFNKVKIISFLNNHLWVFNLCFYVDIFVLVFLFLFCTSLDFEVYAILLGVLAILSLVFIFKPLDNLSISKEDNYNFISLSEIFVSLYILIVCSFLIMFGALYYFDFINFNFILHDSYLSGIFIILDLIILFMAIPSIFFLIYVQKRITNPITKLSSFLSNYFKNDSFVADEEVNYFKNSFRFLNRDTEVSTLSKSFYKMHNNLNYYIKNIKLLNAEKEKVEAELNVAYEIQNSFLPTDFKINPNIKIDGVMIPAKFVGGDFYDFFMIDDSHFFFMIGDVSDKGVPAALFMSKSIQLIRSYLSYLTDFEEFDKMIKLINNQLHKNNDSFMFVTAWMGIIDLNTGKLNYINAGHEQPILRSNNDFSFLDSETDLVLGLMKNTNYKVYELNLNKCDGILLYTDGVTDANDVNKNFYSQDNLLNLIKSKNSSHKTIIKDIEMDVRDFSRNQSQFDDFTLLAIEYNPSKKE